MVSSNTGGYVLSNEFGLVESSFLGDLVKAGGLLSVTQNINGLVAANTPIYTIPVDKVVIINSLVVRLINAVGLTGIMGAGIGVNASADDIYASAPMTGFNATNKFYIFSSSGVKRLASAGEIINFGIDNPFTGTTANLTVYLFGMLDS